MWEKSIIPLCKVVAVCKVLTYLESIWFQILNGKKNKKQKKQTTPKICLFSTNTKPLWEAIVLKNASSVETLKFVDVSRSSGLKISNSNGIQWDRESKENKQSCKWSSFSTVSSEQGLKQLYCWERRWLCDYVALPCCTTLQDVMQHLWMKSVFVYSFLSLNEFGAYC